MREYYLKKYTDLSKNEEDRAIEIHNQSYVINGLMLTGSGVGNIASGVKLFDVMKEGGVTAGNLTIGSGDFMDPMTRIADLYRAFNIVGRDKYFYAESVEDIKRAKKVGGVALIFGFQNTLPIYRAQSWKHKYINWIEVFYNLGVRIIQLTLQLMNKVGCGCGEIEESGKDCGLSAYGVEVVEDMNRLGILVDLSHCGHMTTMDAIEVTKYPPAFTHACVSEINDFCRCKTDDEIKALAEKRGVMGIVAISSFVNPRDSKGNIVPASMGDFLDHIDYVADLVGVDYVGIGTDIFEFRSAEVFEAEKIGSISTAGYDPKRAYMGDKMYAEGISSMAKSLNITRGLVGRGYSDQEIGKILGGNFLKLFEKVWK